MRALFRYALSLLLDRARVLFDCGYPFVVNTWPHVPVMA